MADIARGTETSDQTFEEGLNWLTSLEITPLVVKKECLGFVFNRVWRAIKKECLQIWSGGYADKEAVDKAWKIFTGMSKGPFGLMDVRRLKKWLTKVNWELNLVKAFINTNKATTINKTLPSWTLERMIVIATTSVR
jgi:phosphopantetheinyl transferase (holo-ACP synthase)